MSAPKQQVSPGEPRPAPGLRGTLIVAHGKIFDDRTLANCADAPLGHAVGVKDHLAVTIEPWKQHMKHYVDAPQHQ